MLCLSRRHLLSMRDWFHDDHLPCCPPQISLACPDYFKNNGWVKGPVGQGPLAFSLAKAAMNILDGADMVRGWGYQTAPLAAQSFPIDTQIQSYRLTWTNCLRGKV